MKKPPAPTASELELERRLQEAERLAEARQKRVDELLKEREGLLKDLAAEREQRALANENLARAMGYIDRITDQETPEPPPAPAQPVYVEHTLAPKGPRLRELVKPDPYNNYYPRR